jgi:NAD(P)-dependent dehydrogenase (short-subunit alcohol dehydrogenase family)
VVLTDRDRPAAGDGWEIAQTTGGDLPFHRGCALKADDQAAAFVLDRWRLDVLVNNAGIYYEDH